MLMVHLQRSHVLPFSYVPQAVTVTCSVPPARRWRQMAPQVRQFPSCRGLLLKHLLYVSERAHAKTDAVPRSTLY